MPVAAAPVFAAEGHDPLAISEEAPAWATPSETVLELEAAPFAEPAAPIAEGPTSAWATGPAPEPLPEIEPIDELDVLDVTDVVAPVAAAPVENVDELDVVDVTDVVAPVAAAPVENVDELDMVEVTDLGPARTEPELELELVEELTPGPPVGAGLPADPEPIPASMLVKSLRAAATPVPMVSAAPVLAPAPAAARPAPVVPR